MRTARLYQHKWFLIQLPLALAAALAAACLWINVFPIPPASLRFTTAGLEGAYYRNAQLYAASFAAHGVALEVESSAGSQENLDKLRRPAHPSDLAFVQGGYGYLGNAFENRGRSHIETLANVDIEPVWIFTRNREIDSLSQLQGLRLALGPAGSGNRKVGLKLLEQARIDTTDLTLSGLMGSAAVQALRLGTVDAVLLVASPASRAVQGMLALPNIHLANLRKSTAITERNPYLEARLLAQGSLDARMPPRDITLLTTSTSLVAREDLHPALKRLAVAVAMEVHSGDGLLHRAGDFPSLRRIDFPTSPQAREVMMHGLPFLERALPFWWAQVTERVLLIVLPVLLMMVLLMRLIPAYLRWLIESRVNRWYGELKFIENDLNQAPLTGLDIARFLQRLDGIDRSLMSFATPRNLMTRCYTLHQHIEFVRQRLYGMRGR